MTTCPECHGARKVRVRERRPGDWRPMEYTVCCPRCRGVGAVFGPVPDEAMAAVEKMEKGK